MDLSSIISTTAIVIKGVDDFAISVKDAPKSCELLKAELSSTQNILAELDNLIKQGDSEVRCFATDSYHRIELTLDQEAAIGQLIGGNDQLKRLQTTLYDLSKWLHTLQPNSERMTLVRRLLWSSSAQHKRIKKFLSEMREFKSTATLALTITSRYILTSLTMVP